MDLAVNIAVLARAPVSGATKTRLIPAIGAPAAARLHRAMILKTLQTVTAANLGGDIIVWATPDLNNYFFKGLQKIGFICREQPEGDLGKRMQTALIAGFPRPTLLLGTDCPSITPTHLKVAAKSLIDGCDAVFLPAEDGGYGLVGLRSSAPSILFDDMVWSTNTVMSETRNRLKTIGFKWAEPAVIWDVDIPADLQRLHNLGCSFYLPLEKTKC